MPSWNEIVKEINTNPGVFDDVRRKYLSELSAYTDRNVIIYYSGWNEKGHFAQHGFRFDIHDGDKIGFMSTVKGLDKKKGLDLILHTPGGSIGATESIVHYLRSIFGNDIRAIIPQIAMSAGTMIALSCKEILLGKHSNLGPIDPQIGGMPTHGIIEEFNTAVREITNNPAMAQVWQFILSKYNPTLIGECQKAIDWSESIVKKWMLSNMFESEKDGAAIVDKIINELGSHATTLSHDRHFHLDQLKEMGLKIFEIEDDKDLQDKILSVHHSTIITLSQTKAYKVIENQNGQAVIQVAG